MTKNVQEQNANQVHGQTDTKTWTKSKWKIKNKHKRSQDQGQLKFYENNLSTADLS